MAFNNYSSSAVSTPVKGEPVRSVPVTETELSLAGIFNWAG